VTKRAFGNVYYGLDACMANLMRPGMYEAYHSPAVDSSSKSLLLILK